MEKNKTEKLKKLEQVINNIGVKYVINWEVVSRCPHLSEEFIEKYKDELNWDHISVFQELSESFIEKYQDYVNWCNIMIYQKLSKEFRDKFENILSQK